jgi:hypothetical protein
MGVVVDEARRDDPPLGVDRVHSSRAIRLADANDPAVFYCDIGLEGWFARAVDDPAVLDYQIVRHPPLLPNSDPLFEVLIAIEA